MSYHGDIALGDTIDIQFTTVQSTGAPITLAGTPAVSAYIGNSTTQITAGITLTVDLDAVTGLHNVRVVATGGNGYTAQSNVTLVITTGTINSVSAVGYVVGSFSIENRSALRPTTAGRTLDVAANGALDTDSMTAIAAAVWTDIRAGYKGTGTAAGGGANSIILASGAGAAIDVKAGDFIMVLIDGVPDGNVVQSISTDTCTMEGNWGGGIAPDADDTYYVFAGGSGVTTGTVATAVRTEMDSSSTVLATIAQDTTTDIPALIAVVQADTDNLQTRLPAALTGAGNIKADIIGISGDTTAADNLEAALDGTGGVTFSVSHTAAERTAAAVALLGTGIDASGASARTVRQALALNRNKFSLDPTTGALIVYDTDDTTVLWTGTGTFAASARNALQTMDPA